MNRRQFIAKLPALFAAMAAVPAAMAGIQANRQGGLFAPAIGGRPWGKPVVAVHPDLLKRKTVRVSKEFMDDAGNADYYDSIRKWMYENVFLQDDNGT